MKCRGRLLVLLVAVAAILFGLLFGAEAGAMGWSHSFISLESKTTAILTLSIFGLYCLSAFLWVAIRGKALADYDVGVLAYAAIFGFVLAYCFAYLFQDCSIFKHCSNRPERYCEEYECR